MADYPGHLARRHTLADGREVTIRPVREEDAEGERRFLRGLSSASRRLRFMRNVEAPSEQLVHFYTHVDYRRHMAFVCEAGDRLVGEARYVGNADGRSCELGIVVADDWHHTGIAQLLMQALMDAARSRGYRRMEGLVLAENADMLGFVAGLGFDVVAAPEDPVAVRVVKQL
jgi:acetyltransferase